MPSLSVNGYGYLGALGTSEKFYRLHETHVLGTLAVDFQYLVIGLESGPIRRRSLNGRYHCEYTVNKGYFNADACKAALGFNLQFLEILRFHKGGVGIQRGEHAVDCAVYQLLRVNRFNIVSLNQVKYRGEEPELFVGTVVPCSGDFACLICSCGKKESRKYSYRSEEEFFP